MKTTKKALLLALCAVLLVVSTVFATMAYLNDTTKVVKNTFTVGNVTITLDETDVDVHGVKESDTRVTENEYHLIPGHTYLKDPTVHVDATSENCFLFVKVTNEIEGLEATDVATIAQQMADLGWSAVDTEKYPGVYYYKEIVGAGMNIPVFNQFKVDGNVKTAEIADKEITIIAYAVQSEGFGSALAAWEAAPSDWTPDAN